MRSTISGVVVRSLDLQAKFASEQFAILMDGDPLDEYLEWHSVTAQIAAIYPFDEVSAGGPALLVSRALLSGSLADARAYFGGNRLARDQTVIVDLSTYPLMGADEFWDLIDSLGGHLSSTSVRRLSRRLAAMPAPTLEVFARRLNALIDTVSSAIRDLRPFGTQVGDSDSLAWAAAAHIAAGRAHAESVLAGDASDLPEVDWANGEFLVQLPAVAFEAREGSRAQFTHVRPSAEQPDTRRDYPAEFHTIVGSRFLVLTERGYAECVAIQTVSPSDDVGAVVSAHAVILAEQLGGSVSSPVEHCNTHTPNVFSGLSVFSILRPWTGTRDAYVSAHIA